MSYVTTKAILDDVQTMLQDDSSVLRAKMLSWLNDIMQRMPIVFPWNCLVKSASLSVASNSITLPEDFLSLDSVSVGSFTFTDEDEISDTDSFLYASGTTPIGYTVSGNTLTFKPSTTEVTATLKYIQEVLTYADAPLDTIFPLKFGPLLKRALLEQYYEYDADERVVGRTDIPFNLTLLRGLITTEIRNKEMLKKYQRYITALGGSNGATS